MTVCWRTDHGLTRGLEAGRQRRVTELLSVVLSEHELGSGGVSPAIVDDVAQGQADRIEPQRQGQRQPCACLGLLERGD